VDAGNVMVRGVVAMGGLVGYHLSQLLALVARYGSVRRRLLRRPRNRQEPGAR
jgi:hypothetical protein